MLEIVTIGFLQDLANKLGYKLEVLGEMVKASNDTDPFFVGSIEKVSRCLLRISK